VSRIERADPNEEAGKFIEKWKVSCEEKDLENYTLFYSRRFKYGSMDLAQWKQYKRHTFMKNGPIHLVLKDMKIRVDGNKMAIRFQQIYDSQAFKDVGVKEMVLCRESGAWKILKEQWYRGR